MPNIEILVEGNVDDAVRGFRNWDLPLVLDVPTLSQTLLEIPLGEEGRWKDPPYLVLECKSITKDVIPINLCILKGNHIIAGNVTLGEEYYKEEKGGAISIIKNEEDMYYGEITLIEQRDLRNEIDLVNKLTESYEKRLETKDEDREKIITDYSQRLAEQRESYKEIISEQQEQIENLNKEKLIDKIAQQSLISEFLTSALLSEIETRGGKSKELSKKINELKKLLDHNHKSKSKRVKR